MAAGDPSGSRAFGPICNGHPQDVEANPVDTSRSLSMGPFDMLETAHKEFVKVYVYINVFSISEISTEKESFVAHFYLRAMWVHPDIKTPEQFDRAKAWQPRFLFMNTTAPPNITGEKFEVSEWRCGREREPTLQWSARYYATFHTQFKLRAFPYDVQQLTMVLATESANAVLLEDRADGVKSILRDYLKLQEFSFQGQPWLEARTQIANGREYSTMNITLQVARKSRSHFWNVLFPMFLMNVMVFATFPVTDIASRLECQLILVLASFAYRQMVAAVLPRIPYLTFGDKYILGSLVFMAVVVLENVWIVFFTDGSDETQSREIDMIATRLFLLAFVMGHIALLGLYVFDQACFLGA